MTIHDLDFYVSIVPSLSTSKRQNWPSPPASGRIQFKVKLASVYSQRGSAISALI